MKDNPSKTICFFNSNQAWGGGEKWHLNTAKVFQHRGYKTLLVTNMRSELQKKAISERMNVYPFYVSNLSFLNPVKIFVMAVFFRTHKVEAIVLNLPSDLKLAGLAAKLAGIKSIIYRRGMPHPLRNTWLNRYLFKKVLTHVVVNSEEIGRSLYKGNEEWFPKDKLVLIYNGIDSAFPIPEARKIYTKKDNEWIIGSAGRLTEQKGQKYLIEMGEILKAKNVNFKILIAGEGELRKTLEEKIQQKGLSSHIQLVGHLTDIPAFLNSLDVFVFPSLFEGSANTLIETLQAQVPTVAFDVSSNPEIIQHRRTGLLAKPFHAEELANAVMEITNSPELREELKRNGLALVKEKFDSRKNLDKLQAII